MKKEYITRIFKVKHADGVVFKGDFFTYVARSRIDGLPLYSCKVESIDGRCDVTDYEFWFKDFVFNGRPGYKPRYKDFELMPSEEWIPQSIGLDIVPVQPMSAPTGTLYYLDYVYDDKSNKNNDVDERLLLMM